MSFKSFNRNQLDLLGYSIDDFVPKDAKCRFIVDIVSSLDLSELYSRYSSIGARAFEPSTLLATWFLAYSESVTSTRVLEEKCRRDAFYMFTCGNQKPDHSTLSRFRQDNLDLLCDYFIQILQIAQSKGYSDFKTIAIDGSKIQAAASPSQSLTNDELNRRLKAVRRDIRTYMQRCDEYDLLESDINNDNIDAVRNKLKKLKKLEKTYVERRRQLKERQKQLKKEHRPGHRITITEPDAPSMRHGKGKSKAPAYNTQIAVDTQTQLIVSNDVVSDRNDFDQFASQHQITEKNLGADKTRRFIADSGYHTLVQLDYIEQNQVEALITDPTPENRTISNAPASVKELLKSGRQLKRADFYFDSKNDCYICPTGHQLSFSRCLKSHGRKKRQYCAEPKVCQSCALFHQCLTKPKPLGVRKIVRDHQEALAENMLHKTLSDEAKPLLSLRKMSVEPVFGNLKANMGFHRFRLRGLNKVKGEFNLMAIAHNLNKLYKLQFSRIPFDSVFRYLVKELYYFCKCYYNFKTTVVIIA